MALKDGLRITSDIDAVPEGSNCAVIVRHADREGELDQVVRNDEGVNDIGIRRAKLLGSTLGRFPDLRSFSSPIGRCVDTCVHISIGYGKRVEPTCTELLGMSAPFMIDPIRAYDLMREIGLLEFVDRYVHDDLDKNMVLPCSEGMRMMLSYVIENIKGLKGGIGVFVTHDMIITPPMAYYLGYDFWKGLVPFLDGMVLYEKGDGYVARYAGREIPVSGEGVPRRL
ncbi:MAG: histidine phosphatase family protein [Euryarchaeota archaeon]|nr:histidine phosphatase family protein [Euryarchaeota archaeon]